MSNLPIPFSDYEKEVWSSSVILTNPAFKSMQDLLLYARRHDLATYYKVLDEEAKALGISKKGD
ncbi:MAG: hypothetical protein IKX02_00405 [Spirochaetales bacterium]|nr:hypothetical protein [Spirochaetales bacterium]